MAAPINHGARWILIRIVRLWSVSSFGKVKLPYSQEMILMDDKGDKIHATMKRELIYKLGKGLKENSVYAMSTFKVDVNDGHYRTTRHLYKLRFSIDSTIKLVTTAVIRGNDFSFTEPTDFLKREYDCDYLVDVLGILTAVGKEKELLVKGKYEKMIVIELNSDGECFQCTLFGSYVIELNSFLASNDSSNPVVIVTLAKVKEFQGTAALQNTMHGTKLIFNPDIPEAVELKKRMSASGSPSLGLTQLQESPKVSIEEELISLTPRLTIKGLNECQEELNYVVLATVTSIREEGWWYTACDCNKKVYPDSDMYFCPQCNRHVLNVTPRYRIKLTVDDGTSSTTFVLFESDARALLKKSCAEMIGSNNMVNANLTIPAEILALIDKTYLFKVSNDLESMVAQSYMVKRVSNDPAILHSFKEKVLLEGTRPTGGSPNGIDYSNAAITQDLLPKFSETTVEGQAGCSGAEGVVIYIPDELTPAKRACPDGDPNSASSVSSKIPTHDIKVEKD